MNKQNVHKETVKGFGDEWKRFDQKGLIADDRKRILVDYFSIFPWDKLPPNPTGADIGCGSGRWALEVAPKAGCLIAVDASSDAMQVAKDNLSAFSNVQFDNSSVDNMDIEDGSLDFAYSLGVLHHVPDTAAAIKAVSKKLKQNAPFLLYLYYAFDNRGFLYVGLWYISDLIRTMVSRLPYFLRYLISQMLAACIYWPFAKIAQLLHRYGICPRSWPLEYYHDKPFYVMRTDALDRFGTRLEQRFSKAQIEKMLLDAGFMNIAFSDNPPYWCAIGYREE